MHNNVIEENRAARDGSSSHKGLRRDRIPSGEERKGWLRGILVDAAGVPMQSNHNANPRNYISIPTDDPLQVMLRVPIVGLDRLVVRILRRAYLLRPGWCERDVRALLRQVRVSDTTVILSLDKALCLSIWRAWETACESISDNGIIGLVRSALASHATVNSVDEKLVITSQRSFLAPVPGPRESLLARAPKREADYSL